MSKEKQPSGLKILFADDEVALQKLMQAELPRMGHTVTVCPDGVTAVSVLEEESFDCVLVDLDMPGLNGIEVIQKAKELQPLCEAIILTGKSTTQSAVDALRCGAFDYLSKPSKLADIAAILGRVSERRHINMQMSALQLRLRRAEGDSKLVGEHPSMDVVQGLISKVSPTESTVLIRGETGCGKELVARAVHDNSMRAEHPFVAINCGALPENLIESELFGHCRGAFTGADAARTGLFQVADGGTIFLDEIGELPLPIQAKLLRVLESREIRRIGDNQIQTVDVRVVCATHRNLEEMVEQGDFREDLMFRINTFEIHVPSLRDRISDIPELAAHLLKRFNTGEIPGSQLFSAETLEVLKGHVWPGNVRELANVVEHAVILCDELPIQPEHLPRHFGARQLRKELRSSGPMSLREMELVAIEQALERHDGNKSAVAAELGISLKTLYNKLNTALSEKKSA